MRAIKFRAWDPELGMLSWETINDRLMLDFEYDEKTIFMQFTGLKDKNGKEIYEGDVVRVYEHTFSPYDFIVEFSEVNYCWWLTGVITREDGTSFQSYSFSNLNGFQSDCEVIGNIYENEDLLK